MPALTGELALGPQRWAASTIDAFGRRQLSFTLAASMSALVLVLEGRAW